MVCLHAFAQLAIEENNKRRRSVSRTTTTTTSTRAREQHAQYASRKMNERGPCEQDRVGNDRVKKQHIPTSPSRALFSNALAAQLRKQISLVVIIIMMRRRDLQCSPREIRLTSFPFVAVRRSLVVQSNGNALMRELLETHV